jgi:hypothetical protein
MAKTDRRTVGHINLTQTNEKLGTKNNTEKEELAAGQMNRQTCKSDIWIN